MEEEQSREIITVAPDQNGRIIIKLYNTELEIHESMFDKDGVAVLKKFGKIYELQKSGTKKKRSYRKKETPMTIGEALGTSEENKSGVILNENL